MMTIQAKRVALLLVALGSLALSLVACAAGPLQPPTIANNNAGGYAFTTPNPSSFTPTPTFPVFTIGAWVSNYAPSPSDTVTIYVVCKVQDQTMQTAGSPAPSIPITVLVGDPLDQSLSGKTDNVGLAAISYTFNDPSIGQPVVVTVSANYNNQTYTNHTFFTPGATQAPQPTPKGSPGAGTPTGGGG
jgi:hypothetical protein